MVSIASRVEALFLVLVYAQLLILHNGGQAGVGAASVADVPFRDVVVREAGEFLTSWIFFPNDLRRNNSRSTIRGGDEGFIRRGEVESLDEMPLENWRSAFEMAAQANKWFTKLKKNIGVGDRGPLGRADRSSTSVLGAGGTTTATTNVKAKGPSFRRPAALQTVRREIDFARRTAAEILVRIGNLRYQGSLRSNEYQKDSRDPLSQPSEQRHRPTEEEEQLFDHAYRVAEQKLVRGVVAELFSNIQLAVDTAMPRSSLLSAMKVGRERLLDWKHKTILSSSLLASAAPRTTASTLDELARRNATTFVAQHVDHCVSQLSGSLDHEREEHISGPRAPTVFFTTAAKLLLLSITPSEFLVSLSSSNDRANQTLLLVERYFRSCTAPIADGGALEQVMSLRVPGEASFLNLRPVNGRFWFSIRPEVSCYDYSKYCSPFLEERMSLLEPFSLRCTQMCNWNYWFEKATMGLRDVDKATTAHPLGDGVGNSVSERAKTRGGGPEGFDVRSASWTQVLVQTPIRDSGGHYRPQILQSTKVLARGSSGDGRSGSWEVDDAQVSAMSSSLAYKGVNNVTLRVVEITAANFVALGHFLVEDVIQRRRARRRSSGSWETQTSFFSPLSQTLAAADVVMVVLDRAGPKATPDNVWWAMWFHLLLQRVYDVVLTERLDAYAKTSARLVYVSHAAFVEGEMGQRLS